MRLLTRVYFILDFDLLGLYFLVRAVIRNILVIARAHASLALHHVLAYIFERIF